MSDQMRDLIMRQIEEAGEIRRAIAGDPANDYAAIRELACRALSSPQEDVEKLLLKIIARADRHTMTIADDPFSCIDN